MKYVLTASGERYLARVNAQMIRMHLVRVEVGSGVSAAPEKLEALLPGQTCRRTNCSPPPGSTLSRPRPRPAPTTATGAAPSVLSSRTRQP